MPKFWSDKTNKVAKKILVGSALGTGMKMGGAKMGAMMKKKMGSKLPKTPKF